MFGMSLLYSVLLHIIWPYATSPVGRLETAVWLWSGLLASVEWLA